MKKVASRLREIAKLAVANYTGRVEGLFVAYPNRSSGATVIAKYSGSGFEVISLKQNKIWSYSLLQDAYRNGLKSAIVSIGQFRWSRRDYDIFRSVAENLTGDLMADIARVSQEFGKLKYYEKVNASKALKLLTLKESIPALNLLKSFPELPIQQDSEAEKIGPFEVSFDHENPKERESIENLIKRTIQTVAEFGLSKYLYGKIYVVDKLKGRTVADYSPAADCIRLSHKARTSEDLRILLHEIGHRIMNKGGADRAKIRAKFYEVSKGFSLEVQPGAMLTEKKSGKKYKFKGIAYQSRKTPYKLSLVEEEDGQMKERGDYRVSAFYFTNFEGDFKINTEWFPTAYSSTNEDEWFCEILSFALTRGDKHFVEFLKEVT